VVRLVALGVLIATATGCATIPADAGNNPADPWERYNRHMFEFNDTLDRNVLKPVAEGYEEYIPQPVRECIGNFFANIRDIPIGLNNLLQGKPRAGVSDFGRVITNTIAGVFGCFDVATKAGLEKHNEDFGQTLGRWGFDSGPYFIIPLLGPSSVRDAVGRLPDNTLNPQFQLRGATEYPVLFVLDLLDTRASLLPAERAFSGVALDRYQFIRDAYLQRRRSLVYDGSPPEDEVPKYEDPEDADEPPRDTPSPAKDASTGDQPK
jgi:phospholipid-binding lipoprotein MlaA